MSKSSANKYYVYSESLLTGHKTYFTNTYGSKVEYQEEEAVEQVKILNKTSYTYTIYRMEKINASKKEN